MSLFRTLLRLLMSNEQLTQKLAESYPMRRAAQLTAYMYHRGKALSEESLEELKKSEAASRLQETAKNTGDRMREFQRTLEDEIKKQQKK